LVYKLGDVRPEDFARLTMKAAVKSPPKPAYPTGESAQ